MADGALQAWILIAQTLATLAAVIAALYVAHHGWSRQDRDRRDEVDRRRRDYQRRLLVEIADAAAHIGDTGYGAESTTN